mmetsp:Transcript_103919/g.323914  ORF Transcript_103919/g.323914 Transcript_103919/m.323914 type:complete len:683 (+) Transcript_103919:141-2189(+)
MSHPGEVVCITGLTRRQFLHLNGELCRLVSFDDTSGRWLVHLFKDGRGRRVKAEHLRNVDTSELSRTFRPMQDVGIIGLTSAQSRHLNGQMGKLVSLDDASGRWQVSLPGSLGLKLVKAENLMTPSLPTFNEHYVLSVKYDRHRRCSRHAAFAWEIIGDQRCHNPNQVSFSVCDRRDGSCLGRCQEWGAGEAPDWRDCWAAAYRWSLTSCSSRALERGGKPATMLRIVEDGQLGPGQEFEAQIAKDLGTKVIEIHVDTRDYYSGWRKMQHAGEFAKVFLQTFLTLSIALVAAFASEIDVDSLWFEALFTGVHICFITVASCLRACVAHARRHLIPVYTGRGTMHLLYLCRLAQRGWGHQAGLLIGFPAVTAMCDVLLVIGCVPYTLDAARAWAPSMLVSFLGSDFARSAATNAAERHEMAFRVRMASIWASDDAVVGSGVLSLGASAAAISITDLIYHVRQAVGWRPGNIFRASDGIEHHECIMDTTVEGEVRPGEVQVRWQVRACAQHPMPHILSNDCFLRKLGMELARFACINILRYLVWPTYPLDAFLGEAMYRIMYWKILWQRYGELDADRVVTGLFAMPQRTHTSFRVAGRLGPLGSAGSRGDSTLFQSPVIPESRSGAVHTHKPTHASESVGQHTGALTSVGLRPPTCSLPRSRALCVGVRPPFRSKRTGSGLLGD